MEIGANCMAKKKEKTRELEPASYVVRISDYTLEYLCSPNQDYEERPYHESMSLEILGVVGATDSRKIGIGTETEIMVLSQELETAGNTKPKSVGHLWVREGKLYGTVILPPTGVRFIASLLLAEKAEAVDLFGTEFYRGKTLIRSYRLCSRYPWKDWED